MTDEQRRALTPISLRRKARDFALKTVKQQALGFQRWAAKPEGWLQPVPALQLCSCMVPSVPCILVCSLIDAFVAYCVPDN